MAYIPRNPQLLEDKARYVWPGGYPAFYLSEAGNVLCVGCASDPDTSDPAIDADVNWEDPDMHCGDCGFRIESAYAEDDVTGPDRI